MQVAGPAAAGLYDTGSAMLELRLGSLATLLLLLGWAWALRRAQDLRRGSWLRSVGSVIDDRDVGYGADGSSSRSPVVEFSTVAGDRVRGTPLQGTDLGLDRIGRRVPVWYDPEAPGRFEATIHWTDRAGSMLLLVAVVPAVLVVVSFLP